jgi:hypothetical protein
MDEQFCRDVLRDLRSEVRLAEPTTYLEAEAVGVIEFLLAEIERIKRGDFTREEVHGFCHNLTDKVPRAEFEEGCRKYQDRLYGAKKPTHEYMKAYGYWYPLVDAKCQGCGQAFDTSTTGRHVIHGNTLYSNHPACRENASFRRKLERARWLKEYGFCR